MLRLLILSITPSKEAEHTDIQRHKWNRSIRDPERVQLIFFANFGYHRKGDGGNKT